MADALLITLHPQGEESAAGSSTAIDIGAHRSAVLLQAIVTASPGEVELRIETGPTDAGPWKHAGNFDLIAAPLSRKRTFASQRFVRVSWTAALTFSLAGEAHVLYAGLDDLDSGGVRHEALEDIDEGTKIHGLLMATADLDSAFRTRFKLPLVAWGQDVRGRAVSRAIYYCFCHRGFDPEAAQDALVVANGGFLMGDGRATAVERWLRDVALNQVHPDVTDTTPTKREGGARVKSRPSRYRDDYDC